MMEVEVSSPEKAKTQKSFQEKWEERRKRRRLILEDDISQNLLKQETDDTLNHQDREAYTHQIKLNLFREQLQLAKSDVLGYRESKKQAPNLPLTQGFVRCEYLSRLEGNNCENALHASRSLSSEKSEFKDFAISDKEIQFHGTNTQFGISESELLRFCNEAENNNAFKTTVIEKSQQSTTIESNLNDFCKLPVSPGNIGILEYKTSGVETLPQVNKSKSIVEQIMDDFCESPSSSKVCHTFSEEPELRVKREKTIRTYSRHRRCANLNNPKKISEEMATGTANITTNSLLMGADCFSDSSSGLSMQEDLTRQAQVALSIVDLNTSQNIRNNLLDLSAFYTKENNEDSDVNNQTLTPSPRKTNLANSPELFQAISEDVTFSQLQKSQEQNCDSRKILNKNDQKNYSMWGDNDNDLFFNVFETEREFENDCKGLLVESTPFTQKTNGDTEDEITNETAAMKEIKISEVAPKRARSILENFLEENESNKELPISNTSKKIRTEFPKSEYTVRSDNAISGEIVNKISDQECFSSGTMIEIGNKSSTSKFTDCANQLDIKTITNLEEKIETENYWEGIELSEWLVNDDNRNDKTTVPENEFVGFLTASNKSIPVSAKAQVKIKNIFNTLPELLPVTKKDNTTVMKRHTEDISVNNLIENNLNINDKYGFYTASRKFIQVSIKAKESIEKIFDKLPELPGKTVQDNNKNEKNYIEEQLPDLITNDTNQFKIKTNPKSEEKIDTENSLEGIPLSEWFSNDDIQNKITAAIETEFIGFTTASKKSIPISVEAQVKVKNIFNKLPDLTAMKDMKRRTEDMSEAEMGVEKKADNLNAKDLNTNDKFGFYTASKKFIKVSTKAKASIMKIFDNLPDLPANNAKDNKKVVENDIADTLPALIREKKISTKSKPLKNRLILQTASKKSLVISPQTKIQIEHTFSQSSEIPNKCSNNYNNNSIKELCDGIDKEIPLEFTDVQLSEWPLEDAIKPEENVNNMSKKPLQSVTNVSLYQNEKTPVSVKNGSNVTQSSILAIRSPLDNTIKSTIVSRKNLLSIGSHWKQKSRRSMEFATSEASSSSRSVETPSTPNLREFFDSIPKTSTPRQHTNNQAMFNNRKSISQSLKSCEMATDFQEINWEQSNAHNQSHSPGVNTNLNSCAEVSLNSINDSNLSTQQRIQRMSPYYDPPQISPLPTLVNTKKEARVSGLRCSRRLLTKRLL